MKHLFAAEHPSWQRQCREWCSEVNKTDSDEIAISLLKSAHHTLLFCNVCQRICICLVGVTGVRLPSRRSQGMPIAWHKLKSDHCLCILSTINGANKLHAVP